MLQSLFQLTELQLIAAYFYKKKNPESFPLEMW